MKIKVTDIVYDTDIDDDSTTFVLNLDLPSEMIVEVDGIIDIESEIANRGTAWIKKIYKLGAEVKFLEPELIEA